MISSNFSYASRVTASPYSKNQVQFGGALDKLKQVFKGTQREELPVEDTTGTDLTIAGVAGDSFKTQGDGSSAPDAILRMRHRGEP